MPLAFLASRAHCWLMVNLSSTRTPRSLSSELLSSRSTPSLYWCIGLFLPRCRTLHLPLLNLIRFLSAQTSSLSRSRCMAAQPSGASTTPPSLESLANLLRVHSNSSSRSLMKKLGVNAGKMQCYSVTTVSGNRVLNLGYLFVYITTYIGSYEQIFCFLRREVRPFPPS